jgi:hypothetical protein
MSYSEHIQELQIRISFILPKLDSDSSYPPTVDEFTIELRQSSASNITALQFFIGRDSKNDFLPSYSSVGSVADQRPLNLFFQALALGSDTSPPIGTRWSSQCRPASEPYHPSLP